MTQLFNTLRLSAIFLAMISTAAHATPGTITPEPDDTVQQDQNGDDGFIEEDDQDQGQDQDQDQNQDDGYQDDQGQNDQDDSWGDDQGDGQDQDDQYNRDQNGRKNQGKNDGKNGKGQGGKNQDDGYQHPGKPGRDQGKNYGKRPRQFVETVPVRQQFLGGARIPFYMLQNNLQSLQGYRLVGIVINGSSDAGMGMAVFCGSQCGPMQNVGYYINSYPIQTTGERINPYSSQWFLELRGNFWVDSIQLRFAR